MAKAAAAKAAPTKTPAAAPAASETTVKSIVNSKYRDRYKGATKDWLATYLEGVATKTREVKVTVPNPENPDEKITKSENRPDGVDIDKLFGLAKSNGLDVVKYDSQRENHGFAGRFRMTIRNMLQKVVKQRHGLVGLDGKFVSAPPEFLAKCGLEADAKPTHTQTGEKIATPKADKPKADEPAADAGKGGKTK